MKYILSFALALFCTVAIADQRFETVGGFCHFVTPDGFANGNDDAEVFYANCTNAIEQHNDGTGSGSTKVTVKFPGAMPFAGKHKFTGSDTGIECVMVDSNGTEYRTLDWFAVYKASGDDDDYDGMVDDGEGKIKYELTCLNAQQQ